MRNLTPLHTDTSAWAEPDELLVKIAEYVHDFSIDDYDLFHKAKICLLDSLGCAVYALHEPMCKALLGSFGTITNVINGVRVPGTNYVLDPIKGAFDISTMIRWLDFNDTWLGKECGHPSDNIGGILSVADVISQQKIARGEEPLEMKDVYIAMIKAYEIQGVLALENSFHSIGLDHVVLVKVATAAVVSKMLGGGMDQTISAVSNAWVDGQSLRTYRHDINTGARKSWAAGDATARGVQLAWLASFGGDAGCPHALTAPKWGFYDVYFSGKPLQIPQKFETHILDNILFKVQHPAEFHGQSAVECAISLHNEVNERIEEIEKIEIKTQESAMRSINKTGKLNNFADRDHCLQYMVAVGLLYGDLESEHYSDEFAKKETRIDGLRDKMIVSENKSYTRDYLDSKKRAIANSIQIKFKNGSQTDLKEIYYPIGHKKRREEAEPLLKTKYSKAIMSYYTGEQSEALTELWTVPENILGMLPANKFMELFFSTTS